MKLNSHLVKEEKADLQTRNIFETWIISLDT
jgi:hypothetical protein